MERAAAPGITDSFSGRASVAPDEARSLFGFLVRQSHLVWELPVSGCWARAHEMCRLIERSGLGCGKTFAVSRKRLGIGSGVDFRSPKQPILGPWAFWPMHVAPCIQVEDRSGIAEWILDPAVLDHPAPVATWISALGDGLWSLQPWRNYMPGAYGISSGKLALSEFRTDSGFLETRKHLGALAVERERLRRAGHEADGDGSKTRS